jgi:hypothetical protein
MKPTCKVHFWKDGEYMTCGKPAVTMLRDVKCDALIAGGPFPVCRKHKKEFLSKEYNEHYKEVK